MFAKFARPGWFVARHWVRRFSWLPRLSADERNKFESELAAITDKWRGLAITRPLSKTEREDAIARFWKKVEKTEACWQWRGGQTSTMGQIWDGERVVGAHRFSYELHKGPIWPGLYVCHTCDNGMCVNPDHLFVGTPQDNVDDKIRKGRQPRGLAHYKIRRRLGLDPLPTIRNQPARSFEDVT